MVPVLVLVLVEEMAHTRLIQGGRLEKKAKIDTCTIDMVPCQFPNTLRSVILPTLRLVRTTETRAYFHKQSPALLTHVDKGLFLPAETKLPELLH